MSGGVGDQGERKTTRTPSSWFSGKPGRVNISELSDQPRIDEMPAERPAQKGWMVDAQSPKPPSEAGASGDAAEGHFGDSQPWFRGQPNNQQGTPPSAAAVTGRSESPKTPSPSKGDPRWTDKLRDSANEKLARAADSFKKHIEQPISEEFRKYTSPLGSMSPFNRDSHFASIVDPAVEQNDVSEILVSAEHPLGADAAPDAGTTGSPQKDDNLAWFIKKDKADTKLNANCRMFQEKTELERRLQSANDKRRAIRKQVAERKKLADAGPVQSWLANR